MRTKRLRQALTILAALAALTTLARDAAAQAVTVTVMQVKASNPGEARVDPRIGPIGKRIAKIYRYRNYTLVGRQTRQGNIGGSLNFALQGGMSMALGLTGYAAPMVSLSAVVTRGGRQITNSRLTVASGHPLLLSFPWGANRLIVVITPSVIR